MNRRCDVLQTVLSHEPFYSSRPLGGGQSATKIICLRIAWEKVVCRVSLTGTWIRTVPSCGRVVRACVRKDLLEEIVPDRY